ncbi:substrate-binding periplasmic protein [Pseudomaricurvus sp.]|uniref:substrate-binding periplasmic protein n=1 Tax=Pseudomaricurvus sp. TaxID=2004510 RepID=UPI003F6D87B2
MSLPKRFPLLNRSLALAVSSVLYISQPTHSEIPSTSNKPSSELKEIRVSAPLYTTFTEQGGEGLFFDIFREVFEPQGYSISTTIVPIRRSIRLLQLKQVDAYLTDWHQSYLTVEAGYQPETLYTPSQPISLELISAISLVNDKPSEARATLTQLSSNRQQLIGWVTGYEYDQLFQLPSESFQTVSSSERGLAMLKAGRLHLFLDDRDNAAAVMRQSDIEATSFNVSPLKNNPLYPVFQNTDRGLTLGNLYDSRMIELHKSGRMAELYQQWGYNYEAHFPATLTDDQ